MRQTAWTLLDPRVAASSPPRPRSDMSPAPVAHPPSARTAASAGTLYSMRILDPGMASEAEMPTCVDGVKRVAPARRLGLRSEEHTSELQSLMRISFAVFCLKKHKQQQQMNSH